MIKALITRGLNAQIPYIITAGLAIGEAETGSWFGKYLRVWIGLGI